MLSQLSYKMFVSVLILSSSLFLKGDALTCWQSAAVAGGTTAGVGAAVLGTTVGAQFSCAQVTTAACKIQTVTPVGLGSLPVTTVSCVDAGTGITSASADTTDTAGSTLGCAVDTTIGTASGTYSPICTTSTLGTGCTRTFVPTTVGAFASVSITCNSATDNSNKPNPLTCFVGTFSTTATGTATTAATSTTLTSFCKNVYSSTTTGAALTVTATTETACATSTTIGCCSTTNCNTVMMCWVGQYNTITTTTASTFVKSVCALQASGVAFQYCKNVYSYAASTGITITGSCELTCTAATVTTTSTSATGTTCSSTAFGNSLSSTQSSYVVSSKIIIAMVSMVVALIL